MDAFDLVGAQRFAQEGQVNDLAAEVLTVLPRQSRRRHLQDGAHASQDKLSARDLLPVAVEMKLVAIERRRQQVPLRRG